MNDYTHFIGCGWPRTGTSSLKAALKILNLPKENCHVGDHIIVSGYNHYQKLDNLYKDAKFIYTTRESAEKWLSSVKKRTKVIGGNQAILDNRFRMYGSREVVPELYLPRYWKREVDVTDYFRDKYGDQWKDHLLVVCWEKHSGEESWQVLCDFLGCDVPDEEFPHKNKSKV